jgi:chromosomal replication initiation ATPase DnaA
MQNRRLVSPYVYPGLVITSGEMNLDNFLSECCEKFPFDLDDLKGRSRMQDVAFVRHAICHLLRYKEKKTFTEIGRIFGRDHATAISAVKRWDNLLSYNDHKAQTFNLVVVQCYKRHNFNFISHE